MEGCSTTVLAGAWRLAVALALCAISNLHLLGTVPFVPHEAGRPFARVVGPAVPSPIALRPGALAAGALRLVGLRLAPPTTRIDVPSGATILVPIPILIGDHPATAPELAELLPPGAQLEGVLTGPGLAAVPLVGAVRSGLPVPALGSVGDFQISGIRIVKDGVAILDAAGASVAIRCLGEVLISGVTSTPMTMDEIRASGIQLGHGDYVATRFTLALAIGSRLVNLKVPVAIPVYNGQDALVGEPSLERLELEPAGADLIPDLQVALGGMSPPRNFTLARPELAHVARHAFKSLVVIPGSIGYLQQFFKAQVVVLNALPKDHPDYADYRVGNLSATLAIPAAESSALVAASPISQGLRGNSGDSIGPGENASGTWILKGAKEGSHLLEFQVQGEFTGGSLTGPVPILGTARSKVLVRNPHFDLLLVHPEVVMRGETYTLEARLTNTSGALANGVSVSLDQARLGGARVVGPSSLTVDSLPPGATTSLRFKLRALRNGTVVASYLYSESGGGGFQLAAGLGERNVRLNPDTLVLPQTLDTLPGALRDALLRVMGQAWSVATTKGTLPPGVLPIRASTVTGVLREALSEAGLFLTMGTEKERVWAMLWRAFTQNGDAGFDQLLRTTEAGAELRAELLQARTGWAGGGSLGSRLGALASWNFETELPLLAAVDGAGPGLQVAFAGADGSWSQADAMGAVLGGTWSSFAQDGASMLFQNRFPAGGGQLRLANGGMTAQDLRITMATPLSNAGLPPSLNRYHLMLPAGATAAINVGTLRGPPAAISLPGGTSSSALAESTEDLQPEPFRVLAVHRYDLDMDPRATPFGTHVMVLFNKPNRPVLLPGGEEGFRQGSALVQVEGNNLWRKVLPVNPETGVAAPSPPALVQALPRVVSIYLERPVGPDIPRRLSLSGDWVSTAGEGLGPGSFPVSCGLVPGGARVRGKVRKATGEPVAAKLSYWHFVLADEGGVDLYSGEAFEEDYWALVSNNIDVGADGTFQFDYIPERAKTALGMFTLEARTAEGLAYGSASVLGSGQVLDMDVVVEGRGDVQGRIVDGSGTPIAGAEVALYSEQSSSGNSLDQTERSLQRTGIDGTFRFSRVLSGVFSLRLRKGDIGAARAGAVPAEGGTVSLGDLKLEAATGTLRVLVLNPDGSPCPNQKVLLGVTTGLLRSGTQVDFLYVEAAGTNGLGRVEFTQVPAGDASVRLPYRSAQGPAWYGFLKPGEALDVTLKLPDSLQLARVAVEVKDALSAPVPGAGLALRYGGNPDTWIGSTDAAGKALLPALPDKPFGVIVHHPDWPPEGIISATVTPRSGESLVLSVTLPPRCAVEGKVTRPDGSPVAGAYVAIPPVFDAPSRNRLVRSDHVGFYRLVGLASDKGERIACIGPDLNTAVNLAVQGNPGGTVTLDLRLPIDGRNTLKGMVQQPGATHLPAVADLEAYGELPDITPSQEGNPRWGLPATGLRGVGRSSADGSYRIDGLPNGPFTLQASSVFFPDWSRVTGAFQGPAETLVRDITLIARSAGSLEGQVLLSDGQSPAPAGVRVAVTNASMGELVVETGSDGRYAFARVLPAGTYSLRVEDPRSGSIAAEPIDLPRESNLIHNVRLWGRGTLTVRVQDGLGRALQDGVVTLQHSRQSAAAAGDFPPLSQRLQAARNGVLVWNDLLEGQIRIHLRDPNGLQGLASAEIPFGGGDAEAIVQLQPVGNLRGLLQRPGGIPVPAGRVDAYQAGRWLGLSSTGQDGVEGRFAFATLPTGAVVLEAWDPDTRQTCRATVQVLEDQTVDLVLTTNDLGQVDVRLTKDAAPVDRATLQVRYLGGAALSFRAEATTDSQGRASFMLPPGDYAIQATDPVTLATGAQSFTRRPGQGVLDLEVALRATRDLVVAVAPPRGWIGSLSGWRVRAMKSIYPQRVATLDDRGSATLQAMMADAYTLALYDQAGLYRGARSVAVTEGSAPQEAALQALARGPFEISLLDAHGLPVAAGRVQGRGPADPTANLPEMGTDPQGKVRYPSVLEGAVEANGWSGDRRFQAQGSAHLLAEGSAATLALTLGPSARFQGILSHAGGQPVPWNLVSYRAAGRSLAGQLATDGTGRFASPELPLGTYLLSADDGHRRVGSRTLVLDSVDGVIAADFSLGGSGSFQGTVIDPLRSSVPPVTVEVWLQNVLLAKAAVDAEGAFLLNDLPVGQSMDVRVRMDDGLTIAFTDTLKLDSDGAQVGRTLHLEPRPNLRGHTFASDGNTHQSMNVHLYDRDGTKLVRKTSTSADQPIFQFEYLAPGEYELRGYDQVRLVARRTLTVAAAPELQLADLNALPVRDLKLQLRYPDGSILAATGNARLIPLLAPADFRQGSFDANGALVIRGLPPGEARLEVSGVSNQPVHILTLAIVAGSGPQEVDIPAMGEGSLRIRIRTDAGRDLAGGTLVVRSAGSPEWPAQAQADGSLLVTRVWTGRDLLLSAVGFGVLRAAPAARIANHGQVVDLVWSAPDQGSIQGVVKGADGKPVATASVSLDGGEAQTTDAMGAYRFNAVTVPVNHQLRAEGAGSSPEWVSSPVQVVSDGEQKVFDLQLPGSGAVLITTRDRNGEPVPGILVSLATQNRQSPLKTVTTDASGRGRIEGVMAAAVVAKATLEGRLVQGSGTLAAGGELSLDLKAPDASLVVGAIRRAGPAALWPAGTVAKIGVGTMALQPDGTLANSLDLLYGVAPIAVEVQLPSGGRRFAIGSVPLVKNGTTDLRLTAPPFGTVSVTVLLPGGGPASGAHVQGEGGLRAIADAAGKWDFQALDLGSRAFHAVAGEAAGRATGELLEDGQNLGLAIQLGSRLDVSGRYLDHSGAPLVLFQDGARVFGVWERSPIDGLEGSLAELVFKATARDASGTVKATVDAVFAPDGRSASGSALPLTNAWSASRQPGAAVAVEPASLVQRVSTPKLFRAFVAGIADKTVDWTASAGTVGTDGTFTAPPEPCSVVLTATSHADPAEKATAAIEVRRPLVLSPVSLVLQPGQQSMINAVLTGVDPSDLTWSVTAGTLSPAPDNISAAYTAPPTAGSALLSAVSSKEPDVVATVPITVVLGSIILAPESGQLYRGEKIRVLATVTGLSDTTLVWTATSGTVAGTGLSVDFTPPQADGPVTLTAASPTNPAVKGSATFQVVRRGSLSLYIKTEEGRPLSGKTLSLTWAEGGKSQLLSGPSMAFYDLPVGTPITLKDSTAVVDPWHPAVPDQAFTLASGEAKSLTITIPMGKLTLQVSRATSPLADIPVELSIAGRRRAWTYVGGAHPYDNFTDGSGQLVVSDVPMNVPIEAVFTWQGRTLSRTLTLAQGAQTLPVLWPDNRLLVRVVRGGQPVPGVRVELAGAVNLLDLGPSDASGLLTIPDLPDHAPFIATLHRYPVTLVREITLTQSETTLDVDWPPLSQVSVELRRKNGLAAPSGAWSWSASPGGEGPPPTGDGPKQTWQDLPQGIAQQITGQYLLQFQGNPVFLCNGWSAGLALNPSQAVESRTLTLPALASLRFVFKDKAGQVLNGPMRLGALMVSLRRTDCGGPSLWFSNFDQVAFPEIVPEGTHTFDLKSWPWGPLPPITVTVGAADDGQEVVVPVVLPWSLSTLDLKVRAGDHETPVPEADIQLIRADGSETTLARTGYWDADSGTRIELHGPDQEDITLQARYRPRRQAVPLRSPAHPFRTGGSLQATLEIPLTVVRARLTETDGSRLDDQGLLALGAGEPGPADRCPTTDVGGVRHAVVLGEPALSQISLGLFDPDSGLGQRATVMVPALGSALTVERALAPHAWLSGASLAASNGVPPARLLLALDSKAPELVQPAAASWLFDGMDLTTLPLGACLQEDGLRPDYSVDYWDPTEVPDLAAPPQPVGKWLPRVRVPRLSELWAAEWTLQGDAIEDGSGALQYVTVAARPGRWGHLPIDAKTEEALTPEVPESTPVWVPVQVRVLDPNEKPLPSQAQQELVLGLWPLRAPTAWKIPVEVGPDGQGLWGSALPVQVPLHMESLPWTCGGIETWWSGFLDFTPTAPPPALPPVLMLVESRLPPCPSSPSGAIKIARPLRPRPQHGSSLR